jgi:tetratricopeptide (TPR) repeat protein
MSIGVLIMGADAEAGMRGDMSAPPAPAGLSTPAGFVDALRFLRAWSGLTFRRLSARAETFGDALPASTIATALSRSTLPRREVVEAFTRACGLDASTVKAWVAARDALAMPPARHGWVRPAPTLAPVDTESSDTLPHPAMLPPAIADFTGRAAEVEAVLDVLMPRGSEPSIPLPMAGISGMGGIGKTTLATQVAHRLVAAYPDGQFWVNLRGIEPDPLDPGEALGRFLRALGVPDRALPAGTAERADLFRTRTAGRRMLVVLDNAGCEQQIRPLLPGRGSCAVMVTARTHLAGLESVRWVALAAFSSAESMRLLAHIAGDRITAQADQAARITELCGDLPLAIRIAGARLAARPTWQVSHLAALLDDERHRLDHLRAGDLAVRASLQLSYQALDEPTRRLFRLLGLLDAPDFAGWLAAAVLQRPLREAIEHVELLVDAQLLAVAPVGRTGQLRYRFHDLVRMYAHERALVEEHEPERRRAVARGLGGWLAVAERMAMVIPGPCFAPIHGAAPRPERDEVERYIGGTDAQDWFDDERVALSSAVRQACRYGLDEVAFDLAGCLEKYFDLRGMYAEWSALNTAALNACRRNGNRLGEATVRRGLLDVRTWIDAAPSADAMGGLLAEGQRLLELFTELGHEQGASDTAVMCAWAHAARGELTEALAMVTRALQLAETSGHLGGQVRARLALAVALHEQRQFAGAAEQARLALDKARLLGNPRVEATALQFLGIAHRDLCEYTSGERMLRDSVAISRRHRDQYTQTLSVLALARLYLSCDDPRMRPTAESALALSREYCMGHHIAESLTVLGEIELASGCHRRAIAYLEESVAIWRTRGWYSFHAAALVSLGRAQAPTDVHAAHRSFTEAAELYTRAGQTAAASEAAQLARLTQH